MNYLIGASLVAALLVAVCSRQIVQADESQVSKDSFNYVAKECSQKLMEIDSLAKFEEFMGQYGSVVSHTAKPRRGLMNSDKGLRKCYDMGDQLRALRQILAHRHEGVCRMAFVEQLVDFHSKYLLAREEQHPETKATQKSHYAAHIFSLIAHQVALTCKAHLSARLRDLQSRHSCNQVIASFMPPGSLNGLADMSESREPDSISSFLMQFERVEDLALITRRESTSSEPYFDIIVSPAVLSRIEELKKQCRAREPHYMGIFAPIVALSQIGYAAPDELVEDDQGAKIEPDILKCWLATAQLCQGILRTHINAKQTNEDSQADLMDESGEKKLIEIKFGPTPSDVQIDWTQSAERLDDSPVITFDELSPAAIVLAKKRSALGQKMKRKMVNWARKFAENHMVIEGLRDEGARNFMEALTRDYDDSDSPVAFAGQKRNQGTYFAPRLVGDSADSIVQSMSFFAPKGIATLFSSAVGLCLSAVFVWFSLYAMVTAMSRSTLADSSGNFKEDWRKLRDDRMKTIDAKIKRKGWKDKMMIYSSPTTS